MSRNDSGVHGIRAENKASTSGGDDRENMMVMQVRSPALNPI